MQPNEMELPVEAISEEQRIEEGGVAQETATDEKLTTPDSQENVAGTEPVAEQVEVEVIVPPEDLDAEGFPIIPEEAFSMFEAVGMPEDAARQIIDTAKETARALRAQQAVEELDKESLDLIEQSIKTVKMYYKTYHDLKKELPSQEEMLNFISDLFDKQYFESHLGLPAYRTHGSFVGGIAGRFAKTKTRLDNTQDLLVFFNPRKYFDQVKDYGLLIRKLYEINGVNGQASKSVIDRSHFIPIVMTSAIIKFVENGSESIEIPGVKKILSEMDVRSKDVPEEYGSRLAYTYARLKKLIDRLVEELKTPDGSSLQNFISAYLAYAMEDRDINRKKVGDERRSLWVSIIRGRIAEFLDVSAKFVKPGSFDSITDEAEKEKAIREVATTYVSMLIQNVTMLAYIADIWNFSGEIRQDSTDKQSAGNEVIRYYIGQISYWSWILLNFTGDTEEELEAFYNASNGANVEVFKAHNSFKNMNHPAIRGEFFGIFENAIELITALFASIDMVPTKAQLDNLTGAVKQDHSTL
jgi:hypothetical protein